MKKATREYEAKIDRLLSAVMRLEEGMNRLLSVGDQETVSPKEVCCLLKISRSTYRRYVDGGLIKEIQPGGKGTKVLVPLSGIEHLLKEGKI
ncbi:MAG: helix-turn-helix domain-containing protein [Prevotella sp.]|jgi:hypothetical protein|nr:helix-turn-helix domain-containing protein [Prevotella sp.]